MMQSLYAIEKNTGLIIKYKKLKFKIYYILRFFLSIKMYNAF